MKVLLFLLAIVLSAPIFAQETDDSLHTNELGFDGYANGSNFGGSFGIGIKYGFIKNKNILLGPSLRIQRSWSNYYGINYGFLIYGGGVFMHYRIQNVFFLGGEFEMLNSPLNYTGVFTTKKWVPTFFVGGGYSHAFKSGIRLNCGVFYDILDQVNSPFRTSYKLKRANGTLIPVIYRIGLFIPLQ